VIKIIVVLDGFGKNRVKRRKKVTLELLGKSDDYIEAEN
jgi:hypothetical protein